MIADNLGWRVMAGEFLGQQFGVATSVFGGGVRIPDDVMHDSVSGVI